MSPLSSNSQPSFDNLASIMEALSKQKFTESSNGQKHYAQEDKVYVKLGTKDTYVAEIGRQAKKTKGITADALAETVEKVVKEAITSRVFQEQTPEKLENFINGLEILYDRVQFHRSSWSSLKRFFLNAFGYQEKYDLALEKIKNALILAKKERLPIEIEHLRGKVIANKVEINLIEMDLERLQNKTLVSHKTEKELQDQLREKQLELAEVQKKFQEAENKLLKLREGIISAPLQMTKPLFQSPLLKLLPADTHEQRNFFNYLIEKFGPTDQGDLDCYAAYRRQLIFGFSVGQKHALNSLNQQIDFTIEDLHQMLEGGNSFINMFYVAHYLENFIPLAKSSEKDPVYIRALEQLQADLKRSLPLAFKLTAIGSDRKYQQQPHLADKELKQLAVDLRSELQCMKPGDRLLVPLGTNDHSTMLCLQKRSDETLLPVFYNTGEGVEQHLTMDMSAKAFVEFLNVLNERLPVTKTYSPIDLKGDNSNFDQMMIDLYKMTFSTSSTMLGLNQTLRRNLGKGYSGKPRRIQISGVCSFQSLSEVIKDIMGSKMTYNTHKHDFLSYVQNEVQELTDGMQPQTEDEKKLLQLQQKMLQDNQIQINRAAKMIRKQKKAT